MTQSIETNLYKHTATPESELNFRKWHVEALLNQAADLLDRCLRERQSAKELQGKQELFLIDQTLATEQEKLMIEQRDKQVFEIETNKCQAESVWRTNLKENFNQVSVHCGFAYNTPGITHDVQSRDGASIHQAAISSTTNEQAINALTVQAGWEVKFAEWKKIALDSSIAARKRRDELAKDHGPLDLGPMVDALKKRFASDFVDAYVRITVAYDGLREFYGFDGSPPPTNDPAEDLMEPIDANVGWVRNAIRWLIAFGQLDQTWILALSLRECIKNENEWKAINSSDAFEFTAKFSLLAELFSSHRFVRLRGVSGFIIHESPNVAPWTFDIRAPKSAFSYQWAVKPLPIVQEMLPGCRLGRVESRQSTRQPEVAGSISLMNASPISGDGENGSWTIIVKAPKSDRKPLKGLQDAHIELLLAGRPVAPAV